MNKDIAKEHVKRIKFYVCLTIFIFMGGHLLNANLSIKQGIFQCYSVCMLTWGHWRDRHVALCDQELRVKLLELCLQLTQLCVGLFYNVVHVRH